MRFSPACLLIFIALLTGCNAQTQMTSGSDYLARYGNNTPQVQSGQGGKPLSLDEEVVKAATIEPNLHFPMRIGLVRIENGQLTGIPEDEFTLWSDLGAKLGGHYGQFVVIDPLGAEFAAQAVSSGQEQQMSPLQHVVRLVRVGAARQHADAVLVYETKSTANKEDTPLQLLNWTIVGYYLAPSTSVHAQAITNALFLDVRNGYPYATLQGVGNSDTLTPSNTSRDAMLNHQVISRAESVKNLVEQIEPALKKLEAEAEGKSSSGL